MIVVSVHHKLLLYSLPSLHPATQLEGTHSQVIKPVAVYAESESANQSEIWNTYCSHHEGIRVATAGERNTGYELLILPRHDEKRDAIVRHPTSISKFGTSHVIWESPFGSLPSLDCYKTLHTCSQFIQANNHVGYIRLGLSNAPDPSRINSISFDWESGDIDDMVWDQDSGRIIILSNGEESESVDGAESELIIVDLV